MKVLLLVLAALLLMAVVLAFWATWVFYKALYVSKDSVDDLEVYTSDGRFREDVFGSSH